MNSEWKVIERLGPSILGLFVFLTVTMLTAQADDAPQSAARAARLGYVDGQVQISQGSQVLANPAPVNAPLFEGTKVTAGEDGRAEIQFEDGSVARLSPNSTLSLKVLRQTNGGIETEIVLERGLGYFELQAPADGDQFRVRFDDTVTTASGFTVMRIDLDNAPGEIAVFSGNAHVERGTLLALDLHGGESVALNANDLTAYNLAESIEPDSWDAWNADRDRALQGESAKKTDATQGEPNNPAWADLDANGNWYNVPGQGYVWSPYDASSPGWDPYGYGDWMWSPGYGYMWVSGYSWGYMPFQCGTWNYYGGFGWGWGPGAGSCQPWWGGGGWGNRIGIGPPGYRYPVRPHPRPGPPRQPIGPPRQAGTVASHPLVAVDRRPAGRAPVQSRSSFASIDGQTMQPLRPIAPRQPYAGAMGANGNRMGAGYQEMRPATPVQGNGFVSGRPSYAPPARPITTQPVYVPAPSRAPTGGAPASHPSGGTASAPRASSGGGGAVHSGGGGGSPAGGGGSHGGGGGNGGSHH